MDEDLKQFIVEKLESDQISLVNIKGGAAVDMFDRALSKVMANIADINTTMKEREIHIKVKVWPADDRRSIVKFNIEVPPPKLCGQEAVSDHADIAVDPNGHKGIYAKKRISQTSLPFGRVHNISGE
jgi:hypothetical protein